MRIAVTSQNLKTITGHAGKCRRFLVFDIQENQIQRTEKVELAENETVHHGGGKAQQLLQGINVLITGGMGPGFIQRLQAMGIHGVITDETDPVVAVQRYLDGRLSEVESVCDCQHHGHEAKADQERRIPVPGV